MYLGFECRRGVNEAVAANAASNAPALHPTFPDSAAAFGSFGNLEAILAPLHRMRPTNQIVEFWFDRNVTHRRDFARFTMEVTREHDLLAEGDLLSERFERGRRQSTMVEQAKRPHAIISCVTDQPGRQELIRLFSQDDRKRLNDVFRLRHHE